MKERRKVSRHLEHQASYCSRDEEGRDFEGKISPEGAHTRSLERDERDRDGIARCHEGRSRVLNESCSGVLAKGAEIGKKKKKKEPAAAFYRLNVVAR